MRATFRMNEDRSCEMAAARTNFSFIQDLLNVVTGRILDEEEKDDPMFVSTV